MSDETEIESATTESLWHHWAPVFLRDSDIESQTRKGVQNIDTQYQI